jgi:hypothetical protein
VLPIRARIVAGLLVAAMPLAGCGEFDNPAEAQGLTRSDLADQLAAQLRDSASLTYSATYQLAGGRTATIAQAQDPRRSAYRYPGGEVLFTPSATTRCVGKRCTTTAPPAPTSQPPPGLFGEAEKAGLAIPGTVQSLLSAARLDRHVVVDQHDTTVAGRHATCLDLRNVDKAEAGAFSTCITSDGVIGSFTGRLSGTRIDIALTDYADRVPAGAFTP